ncbi:hypothetical protein FOA52_005592 [Chlamydomonas sp. UWO 241]|nr:hypothetical protein FOA52_005592 [Chlamydomonas sp. UWO 241]
MSVSAGEHTMIGALGGVCEVLTMQPVIALKNALQEGRPIPANPLHLYRGLAVNVLSIAPISATQFGVMRFASQLMTGQADAKLTQLQTFSSAAMGGAASAFISSPAELMIIQQQKSGRTLPAEASHYLATHGLANVYRGLAPTLIRETMYTAGYLGVFPLIKSYLDDVHGASLPPGASLLLAGIAGGFCAAGASHPFDTAKTRMQAFPEAKGDYRNLRATMSTIYREGGTKLFFKGIGARMVRIIAATLILNVVRTNVVGHLETTRKAAAAEGAGRA